MRVPIEPEDELPARPAPSAAAETVSRAAETAAEPAPVAEAEASSFPADAAPEDEEEGVR